MPNHNSRRERRGYPRTQNNRNYNSNRRNRQNNDYITVDQVDNPKLPFFAYGIFKPGQLAYSRICEYVDDEKTFKTDIYYRMRIRDGIPLIIPEEVSEYSTTKGFLIYFKEGCEEKAYDVIRKSQPKKLYHWEIIKVDGIPSNVLMSYSKKGSSFPENDINEFKGEKDPFFTDAIDLIEKNLKDKDLYKRIDIEDLTPFFKLQMNYMLLWSAIERYTSLKYDFQSKGKNNKDFANEKTFNEALKKHVNINNYSRKQVYSADDIKMYRLDLDEPEFCINFYYTIRCNVVHRGKSIYKDEDLLKRSLEDLLAIFKDILADTFKDIK